MVHIEDRGFQLADGVYEVVSLINGYIADEAGHLDRLERSLREMRIPLPMPRRSLQLILREFVRRNRLKNAYIYFQVTRGVAPRDFKFPKGDIRPTLGGDDPLVSAVSDGGGGVKKELRKAVTVPDIRWKRRDVKTTALTAQVLAKQAAVDKGAYEAWMVDDDGFVTEGASTNAWIVDKNGTLITRPTENNKILKGVTRNSIQALCKKAGIKLVRNARSPSPEAYKAKEAFITARRNPPSPPHRRKSTAIKCGDGKLGTLTSRLSGPLYFSYAADLQKKERRSGGMRSRTSTHKITSPRLARGSGRPSGRLVSLYKTRRRATDSPRRGCIYIWRV